LAYFRQSDTLSVKVVGTDQQERVLAEVWDGEWCINAEMVKQGLATYDVVSAAISANGVLLETAEALAKPVRSTYRTAGEEGGLGGVVVSVLELSGETRTKLREC
jgi:hypothetical protein